MTKVTNGTVATLTYKVLSTQQPAYLHFLISYHQPSRSLLSFSQSLLHIPRAKTDSGHCAFSSAAPQIWKHILTSKSHHHLTPSNVTSKHSILPRHNFLTTYRLPCTSDLILFNFGALPNILHLCLLISA